MTPRVSVTPEELSSAGSTLNGYGQAIRNVEAPTFGSVANSLQGFTTGTAASELGRVVATSLTTIACRHEELGDAMSCGSSTYQDADDQAAHRLKAVGDLNSGGR